MLYTNFNPYMTYHYEKYNNEIFTILNDSQYS